MTYDEMYSNTNNAFGTEAEAVLKSYYRRMNKSQRILDIGVGQGRNTLFLAREGFTVDAIDPSRIAIETVSALAAQEALPIRTYQCDFATFVPPTDVYSGILVFGLIQILSLEKLKLWTAAGSLVFVTAFTRADASFADYSQRWKSLGKNSFTDGQGNVRTYLETGELLKLFDGYTVLHHWEGVGPEHRHGTAPPEHHAMAEAVLQR
jgi:cyclopropane fatty-acyl-phospholipid synthase-like methyltransferase